MLKKLFFTVVTIWLIIMAAYLAGSNYYKKNVVKHPFKTTSESYTIKVEKGDTLNKIVNFLGDADKFNNVLMVRHYIKSSNIIAIIKPGTYTVKNDISLDDFIKVLGTGTGEADPEVVKITIPEGFTLEKIAQLLQDKGLISKEEFISSCKSFPLPAYAKNDSKRRYILEGYLFPDTYEFKKGSSGKIIVDTMIKRFEYVMNDVQKKMYKSISNDEIDKIITMASIVEGEAAKADERGKVASVFSNRLKKSMRLESCATVLYALGVHKDKLYEKDLAVDSPYNTYKVNALPQGPICSPGRASIEAAIQPEETKYLYFVSKNDGSHFFTDNYNDFLKVKGETQGF